MRASRPVLAHATISTLGCRRRRRGRWPGRTIGGPRIHLISTHSTMATSSAAPESYRGAIAEARGRFSRTLTPTEADIVTGRAGTRKAVFRTMLVPMAEDASVRRRRTALKRFGELDGVDDVEVVGLGELRFSRGSSRPKSCAAAFGRRKPASLACLARFWGTTHLPTGIMRLRCT